LCFHPQMLNKDFQEQKKLVLKPLPNLPP
jgi:hypothetical protein